MHYSMHSIKCSSTILKDNNPFTAINSWNLKGMINKNILNRYVNPSSGIDIGGENSLADN